MLLAAALCAASAGLAQVADFREQRLKWNEPAQPHRVFGNTYYVGTKALGSILVASGEGHVLIDGALAESAALIAANIRTLGFRVEDVKLILNSHAHFDHAGGIAELQRLSGATVAASPWSASVLEFGESQPGDPQFGSHPPMSKVARPRTLRDGETLRVGPIAITAHFTPGHTPGGTSWTWTSCEEKRCKSIVYADSLSPVSAEDFRFTDNADVIRAFEKSYAALRALRCDVLLTPHPEFARDLTGTSACSDYANLQQAWLQRRIAEEKKK